MLNFMLVLACCIAHISNVSSQQTLGVCTRLSIDKLFRRKDIVQKKLRTQLHNVFNDTTLGLNERSHRVKIINIINREINDTVNSFSASLYTLKSLLRGEHKSLQKLKNISRTRLEQLQSSMLRIEEDYKVLLDEEKSEQIAEKQRQKVGSKNILKKFFDSLISDISIAADKLESDLDDEAFKAETHSAKKFNVETVVKVSGEESSGRYLFLSFLFCLKLMFSLLPTVTIYSKIYLYSNDIAKQNYYLFYYFIVRNFYGLTLINFL